MKHYKPVTSSLRGRILTLRADLFKGSSFSNLTVGFSKSAGRNNKGRITAFHRGGGAKRKYRIIYLKSCHHLGGRGWTRLSKNEQGQNFCSRNATPTGNMELKSTEELTQLSHKSISSMYRVVRLEYDPNRTAHIALTEKVKEDKSGCALSYILAPDGISPGDIMVSNTTNPYNIGNTLRLNEIPVGTTVHNVELVPGNGGSIARAAGTSARVLSRQDHLVTIELPSKRRMHLPKNCVATIGRVSNIRHSETRLSKAGQSRQRGRRPIVRGAAMNPVAHPMGGRGHGSRPSVSPWGVLCKGYPTVNKRKKSRKPWLAIRNGLTRRS